MRCKCEDKKIFPELTLKLSSKGPIDTHCKGTDANRSLRLMLSPHCHERNNKRHLNTFFSDSIKIISREERKNLFQVKGKQEKMLITQYETFDDLFQSKRDFLCYDEKYSSKKGTDEDVSVCDMFRGSSSLVTHSLIFIHNIFVSSLSFKFGGVLKLSHSIWVKSTKIN